MVWLSAVKRSPYLFHRRLFDVQSHDVSNKNANIHIPLETERYRQIYLFKVNIYQKVQKCYIFTLDVTNTQKNNSLKDMLFIYVPKNVDYSKSYLI